MTRSATAATDRPPALGRTLAIVVCRRCVLTMPAALAGDWPQILGPHRNGLADDERLAASWPDAGPRCCGSAQSARDSPDWPCKATLPSCFIAWAMT